MNREQSVEECDATQAAKGFAADNIIFLMNAKTKRYDDL